MFLSQGDNNEHAITRQPPESFIHQSSEWVRAKAYEDIPEGFFENPGLVMRSSLRDTQMSQMIAIVSRSETTEPYWRSGNGIGGDMTEGG